MPALAEQQVDVMHPDEFLSTVMSLADVARAFRQWRLSLHRHVDVEKLLSRLARDGQTRTAQLLAQGWAAGQLEL